MITHINQSGADGFACLGVIVILAELLTTLPYSVAFTKRVTVPEVFPAVNLTWLPVAGLIVPIEGLLRVQLNVGPAMQAPAEHIGVAVNVRDPPSVTETETWFSDTEAIASTMIVIVAELVTDATPSVAVTARDTFPEV
jgi:hypothetical protein